MRNSTIYFFRFSALAFLAALFVAPAVAQTDQWSPDFHHAGLGLSSRVFALTVFRGELVAGGRVARGHGRFLPGGVVRYDPKSRTWNDLGGGVTIRQFNGKKLPGTIRAFAIYNKELIVAGQFNMAGSVAASNIARWDGTRFRTLGAGLGRSNSLVHALAVHKGKLYAAGQFLSAGGVAASHLAVWDGTRWSAVGSGLSWKTTGGNGRALLAASDGSLYVGGRFDIAGGVTAANVARFDGTRFWRLGLGTSSDVKALAEWKGKIFAGGRFDWAGRVANTWHVAGWNGRSWFALAAGIRNTKFTEVNSLWAHGGSLFVGGRFFSASNVSAQHVVRWDGLRFSGFGGVAGTVFITSAPLVLAMTSLGSELVVGGEFWRIGGPTDPEKRLVSRSVAAVDPLKATWRQLGRGAGFAVNAKVYDVVQWRGSTVAAGAFSMAGSTKTTGVVQFDGNDWRDLGLPYGQAWALAVLGNDLYVGVIFPKNSGVLRYDGSRWTQVGSTGATRDLAVYKGRLYKDGSGYITAWNGSAWQTVGPRFGGTAQVLHVHGGLLYAGGLIYASAGISQGIFAFDGSKAIPLGTGVGGRVSAIGSFGKDLVVGGTFRRAGKVSLAAGLARWDSSKWNALDQGLPSLSTPDDFAVLNGELYVGGGFTVSSSRTSYGVARLRSGFWTILTNGPIGHVHVLHADTRTGQLWAGGIFTKSATMPMDYIALLSTRDGWRELNGGVTGTNGMPALSGHGTVSSNGLVRFLLQNARSGARGFHVFGAARIDLGLFGGTLVPRPDAIVPFAVGPFGTTTLSIQLPAQITPGLDLFAQDWLLDPRAAHGMAASNAITTRTR